MKKGCVFLISQKNGGKSKLAPWDLLNFRPTSRLKTCLKINAQVVNQGESPLSVSLYRLYQIIPHHFRSSAHFLGPTLLLFSPRTCSGANCKRRQSSATEDRLSAKTCGDYHIVTLYTVHYQWSVIRIAYAVRWIAICHSPIHRRSHQAGRLLNPRPMAETEARWGFRYAITLVNPGNNSLNWDKDM